jgi:hypothetical protein
VATLSRVDSAEVVSGRGCDAYQVTAVEAMPEASDSGTAAARDHGGDCHHARRDLALGEGFVGAACIRVAPAVDVVLVHPQQLAREHREHDPHRAPGPSGEEGEDSRTPR